MAKKSKKREAKKSEKTEDRLSDLPDSILIHILSMLCEDTEDSKEVVRTSVVSKRWQFLWMSVPVSLEIEIPDDCCFGPPGKWERHVLDYLNSTNRELHYWRSCHKIRKFSVNCDSSDTERFVKDVHLWVYFASKLANVEHFRLRYEGAYEFPQFAFKNTSWRKLDIQLGETLNPSANVNWSGMVSLSLRYMYLTDGVMEKVLSGCPNLECLKLYHFVDVHRLEISNVNLRKLIIDNSETDQCDLSLEILAPYIQNLKILGSCREIYLRNVASLVNAVLNFEFDCYIEEEDTLPRMECTCLKELLHSVAHVEKLELGPWCIQYLSILELEGWQPPPSSWKFLQLSTTLRQLDFPGICSFLQSSSDLETLVVDGYRESRALLLRYTNTDEQIRRFETHDFNCSFLHLKTIKILEFSVSLMPLVKYLLKHAVVLEKFIIAAKYKKSDLYYVKRAQELLSIPRSSPQASVIFSYR
ncbi:F-box protein At5g03100-like [Solanum stenotomum]|uniref:F-box protein At5g03100-like n=1 Tax=Solanum stenotomum TaxID=172797 RepID=UPI0020D097DA|nr:F-box protein At5g03100-like [Solanum stenotomum]